MTQSATSFGLLKQWHQSADPSLNLLPANSSNSNRHSAYYFNHPSVRVNSMHDEFDNSYENEDNDDDDEDDEDDDDDDDPSATNEPHEQNQASLYGFESANSKQPESKPSRSKKLNKLFKFIKSNTNSSETSDTVTTIGVKKRDGEKVLNRKKNNLFAKSLIIMSSAYSKSKSNLSNNTYQSNEPTMLSFAPLSELTSHHASNAYDNATHTTTVTSISRSDNVKTSSSSSGGGGAASNAINNKIKYLKTKISSQSQTSTCNNNHSSCSASSSGCSSAASSSNLSSTRRLTYKQNSCHSANACSSTSTTATPSNTINKCSTPKNAQEAAAESSSQTHQSLRNNSYLHGLNATSASTGSYSCSSGGVGAVNNSPASALSLDKVSSNGTTGSGCAASAEKDNMLVDSRRAQNRKADQDRLKSKSMYAENEFMGDQDDEDDEDDDDEPDEHDVDDYAEADGEDGHRKPKSSSSRVSHFRNRLSLKLKSKTNGSNTGATSTTPSTSRDSGIISDLFAHLGSMSNLKCRLHSAGESLRQSFSVFNLKSTSSSSDISRHNRKRKTLAECNQSYFATDSSIAAAHSESSDKSQQQQQQNSQQFEQADQSNSSSSKMSQFRSILKRGASVSSAASSSCTPASKLNDSSQISAAASASSSSFSNYPQPIMNTNNNSSSNASNSLLKRTTTFHSTQNQHHAQSFDEEAVAAPPNVSNNGRKISEGGGSSLSSSSYQSQFYQQHRKSLDYSQIQQPLSALNSTNIPVIIENSLVNTNQSASSNRIFQALNNIRPVTQYEPAVGCDFNKLVKNNYNYGSFGNTNSSLLRPLQQQQQQHQPNIAKKSSNVLNGNANRLITPPSYSSTFSNHPSGVNTSTTTASSSNQPSSKQQNSMLVPLFVK